MKRNMLFASLLAVLFFSNVAFADTRGSIRGKAVDPTGAVVVGATVNLINVMDGQGATTTTDQEGQYEFNFVEVGPYKVAAEAKGFRSVSQNTTVISGQRVELNLRFSDVSAVNEEITVTETNSQVEMRNTSVQTGFTMSNISHLAGASESDAGIEAYTGTAWRSQEHLHIRGAHQVGYQVNGIGVQDLSLFGPVTPIIDPRNLKFAEVTTGGLLPEFGNRTAGIVNAITRSGFDHGERGRIETSGGSLGRESLFVNYGDHISDKFAYYVQGTALASRRGLDPPPSSLTRFDYNHNGLPDILDPPASQDVHNFRRTFQNFGNFEWLPNSKDSFNLVLGGFRSDFQIPNTLEQQSFGRDYVQFERDHFQNLRWTRALSAEKLLTVSGYHHFTKLEVDGRSDDPSLPLAVDNRSANYVGGEIALSTSVGRHLLKSGYTVFANRARDAFSIFQNPRSPVAEESFSSHVPVNAWEHSLYLQDQFDATDRLTLNYGGRLDVFSVRYDLTTNPDIDRRYGFLSPRLGAAYKLGSRETVIFGNASYVFLPPPLEFFELPSDAGSPTSRFPKGVSYTPVLPEKDIQYDVGVRFLMKGYRIRVNEWMKRQHMFLDHVQLARLNGTGELINPNIFLPVNLDRARTHGVEAFIEAPAYRGLHTYVNYSLSYSQGFGGIAHGFNNGDPAESKYFFLDHDQRHQVYVGADYQMERWRAFVNGNYAFGSAFPDSSDGLFGECATPNCRLPRHSVVNLTFGKSLTSSVDARVEIENLTNRVYPINLGSDFNGSHVSVPRMVTQRMAYHF
jgi:type 1 fimbria pilin